MRLPGLVIAAVLAGIGPGYAAGEPVGPGITIEVPVVLKEARVVLNLDHPVFEGDVPTGLQFARVMLDRFAADGTDWTIVAIFHGDFGYMALDHAAYERVRGGTVGNPFRQTITDMMKAGVDFEVCGETMKMKGWTNADLIPGIRVNTGANFRIIELVGEGFVQIQP